MSQKTLRAKGRVVNTSTESGIEGARVELWRRDFVKLLEFGNVVHESRESKDVFLGHAISDENGYYFINAEPVCCETESESTPLYYIRLFKDDIGPLDTYNSFTYHPDSSQVIEIDYEFNPNDDFPEKNHSVVGTVQYPDGRVAAGVSVSVYDKCFGQETLVGSIATNSLGLFGINFDSGAFCDPSKESPDLLVRVYAEPDSVSGTPIYESALFSQAPASVVVEITISAEAEQEPTQDEYSTVDGALSGPIGSVDVSTLTSADYALLANESGLSTEQVRSYAFSVEHSSTLQVNGEILYGFFIQGVSTDLLELTSSEREKLIDTLMTAIEDGIISDDFAEQSIADQVDTILAYRAQYLRTELGSLDNPDALASTFSSAGVTSDLKKNIFVETYQSHHGTAEEFWALLESDPEFGVDDATIMRFAIEASELALGHEPLVTALVQQIQSEPIIDASQLAKIPLATWEQVTTTSGAPVVIDGDDDAEKAGNYAKHMFAVCEVKYPHISVFESMKTDSGDRFHDMVEFIEPHTSFDFETTDIPQFVIDNDLTVSDGLKAELVGFQGLFRLANPLGRFSTLSVCRDAGVGSPTDVARMGKQAFMSKIGVNLEFHATSLYARALNSISNTIMVHGAQPGLTPLAGEGDSVVVRSASSPLATGLGVADSIAVPPCESVFGPGAYLVDCFEYLKRTLEVDDGTGTYQTAYDKLAEKRGDITGIELSCANTDTPMPYIDLVNEIFERRICEIEEPDYPLPDGEQPQTTLSANSLKAYPELLVESAYNFLRDQVYPWCFDLWYAEAKAYLSAMGIEKDALIRWFPPTDPADQRTEASEYLGLNEKELELLINNLTEDDIKARWGLDSTQSLEELLDLETLLAKCDTTYPEFIEILDNPAFGQLIDYIEYPSKDTITEARLVAKTPDNVTVPTFFTHLARVMLYQKKVGWPYTTEKRDGTTEPTYSWFTRVFPALGGGEYLRTAAETHELLDRLNVRLDDFLSWWENGIDNRFFKALKLTEEEHEAFKEIIGFSIDTDDSRPTHLKQFIERVDLIRESGISLSETQYLLNLKGESHELYPSQETSDASFSKYCDQVKPELPVFLSDIGGVPVGKEQLQLLGRRFDKALSYYGYSEAAREALVEQAKDTVTSTTGWDLEEKRVAARAFLEQHADSVADVADVDAHLITPSSGSFISDKDQRVTYMLGAFSPDLAINELVEKLSTVLVEDTYFGLDQLVEQAKDIITTDLTSYDAAGLQQFAEEHSDFVSRYFAAFMDPQRALDALVLENEANEVTFLEDPNLRKDFVLQELLTHYASGVIAEEFGITVDVVRSLVIKHLESPLVTDKAAVEFLANDIFGSEYELADLTDGYYQLYLNLAWLTVVTKLVSPSDEVVDYMFKHVFDNSGYLGDAFNVKSLLILMKLDVCARTYQNLEIDIFEIMNAADPVQALIDAMPDWPEADINYICSLIPYDSVTGAWSRERYEWLTNVYEAMMLVAKSGTSAAELYQWSKYSIDKTATDSIREKAEAKIGHEDWLEAGPQIRRELRMQQRDILQAYLLRKDDENDFSEIYDLYEHYLIDSEMEPCTMTSRLKLAISAVQLFTQRTIMGLEAGTEGMFDKSLADEWKWRKNYRLWEANRKVFLYPENWIEPELRDEKSQFFVELEDELLQNEINSENVETAYLNYLHKLDEVANLEVSAIYREYHDGTTDSIIVPTAVNLHPLDIFNYKYVANSILHIFARTKGTPHKYFYRRLEDNIWTPWERVELEIDSDHLLPVIYNRRLYLFWPRFTEKQHYVDQDDPENTPYYEIQFEWSIYKNGQWAPQKISGDFIDDLLIRERAAKYHVDKEELTPLNYTFKISIDDATNELNIWAFFLPNNIAKTPFDPGYTTAADRAVANVGNHTNALLSARGWFMLSDYIFDGFKMDGCTGDLVRWDEDRLMKIIPFMLTRPANTLAEGMKLREIGIRESKALGIKKTGPGFDVAEKKGMPNFMDKPYNQFRHIMSYLWPLNYRYARVLGKTPGDFKVLPAHQDVFFLADAPFFYEDPKRTFFVDTIDEFDPRAIFFEALLLAYFLRDKTAAAPMAPRSLIIEAPPSATQDMIDALAGELSEVMKDGGNVSNALMKGFGGVKISEEAVALYFAQLSLMMSLMPKTWVGKQYSFRTFYHPRTCMFIKQTNRYGLDGLLDPGNGDTQDKIDKYLMRQGAIFPDGFDDPDLFLNTYKPVPWKMRESVPYPQEDIDFDVNGAYSSYNWELFFHAPLMIANQLMQNQKFEEAQKWFHYIFDPTEQNADVTAAVPTKYWKTKPFYSFDPDSDTFNEFVDKEENLAILLKQWRKNPFNPHLIARFRRVTYMRAVTLKYLDNLIAWGDMLFRRDTIESINEASQLYLLASQLLGRRPVTIEHDVLNGELPEGEIGSTYDSLVDNFDPESLGGLIDTTDPLVPDTINEQLHMLHSIAIFGGVPQNSKLLSYWDTVDDRLFKIHNCMNIEGIKRQLDLFAPPIDPGLLVKAAAAGLDFGDVLNDLASPNPVYRFNTLAQRAVEFCNDVKTLGGSLLSALEKKDAEELSALRAGHETSILEAIQQTKEQAIEEAQAQMDALDAQKVIVQDRLTHYETLISAGQLGSEEKIIKKNKMAQVSQDTASGFDQIASVVSGIPNVTIGITPSTTFGGSNLGPIFSATGGVFRRIAAKQSHDANIASIKSGWTRRDEDWELQKTQAEKELEHIDKQMAAAEIRKAIAEKDLENHKLQIANAEEVEVFFKNKYTNKKLYSWMTGKISGVYFQAYQLAHDMARKAEKAYKAEIYEDDRSYVKFDNWDSLHKGLLAGERLHNDIKRLQTAYLDKNSRRLEIRKPISLAMTNPNALMEMRQEGSCTFSLPSMVFDMDYPGQYQRRIKSVSVTIPCVAGPNTNVSAKLSLLNDGMLESPQGNEKKSFRGIESISASTAQNDSGMFELNFGDERFLPFEGAGAISEWQLQLPGQLDSDTGDIVGIRQFDYNTISDVIITIAYTAKEDGALRNTVEKQIVDELEGAEATIGHILSLAVKQPAAVETLNAAAESPNTVTISMSCDDYPYFWGGLTGPKTASVFVVENGQLSENGSFSAVYDRENIVVTAESGAPQVDDIILVVGFSQS